jgi:hypothetical protein
VIRDDRERAAGREAVAQRGRRAPTRELVVDGDAHGLEQRAKSDGPVRAPSAPRIAPTRSSLVRKGASRAANDLAREPTRARLVAVLAEDADELLVARRVEQLPALGARRRATHAHVERRAFPEREAARRVVDLMRGDAKVEQDPVEAKVGDRGDGVDRGVVSLVGGEATASGGGRGGHSPRRAPPDRDRCR